MRRQWHKVLESGLLSPRSLSTVRLPGKTVLLARLEDGTLAAVARFCPHEGADLSGGSVYLGAIDCPRHHYLFDLRTGENRYPHNVFPADRADRIAPLRRFPVKEEAGWIWVGNDDAAEADPYG